MSKEFYKSKFLQYNNTLEMAKAAKNTADYILPLYMNGLAGRMLRLPPPHNRKREILVVYGHHTSLERVFGVAEFLNKYGSVTIPDLPGFGGMEPFYKIGEKPTLDNMADYLAAFIKLRYKNKRLTIAGLSLGFMIVARMLQKHPEIAKKVDILGSMAGFAHKSDFRFKKPTLLIYKIGTAFFSMRLPAAFLKYLVLRRPFIKLGYKLFEPALIKKQHSRVRTSKKNEYRRRVDFEVHLWQVNDPRTYMQIARAMFALDLTHQHIDLAVHHVAVKNDRYFDNLRVEEHMRRIFSDFTVYWAKTPTHASSVIATAKEASLYVPPALRRQLSKNS